MHPSELVVIANFPTLADAQMAKGVLDQVGIHSTIRTDNIGGMYPGVGSVDLIVRADDAERAAETLRR